MSETELLRKALLQRGACRLCMAPDTECVPIFTTSAADKEPLPAKILACVAIKVSPGDRLSARVCHACVSFLNSWQSFKNRCHATQKRHRGLLDSEQMLLRQRNQRSLSTGKTGQTVPGAASAASAANNNVMNQQQIRNHAAQQQRRMEAIQNQRAQMRQQRILKERLTGGNATGSDSAATSTPTPKRAQLPHLNSSDIDVSFIKNEPVDRDDVANATAANVLAGAIADAEDDEDIVDPMQFLANDVTYTDDGPDADDDMDGGDGDNVQPPFLTSLGLTHINHNSDFDGDSTAYDGDADDSAFMLPPNAFRPAAGPKCTICNMKFSNRANARRHERNIHGKVSIQAAAVGAAGAGGSGAGGSGGDMGGLGAAAAAAMLALSQNHQISITAPARPMAGGQQSLLLRSQPNVATNAAAMMLARRQALQQSVRPTYDYTQPQLYRELLTDAKLNFIRRHIEFLDQYQNMRCICCPRDFPTYKLFMAHMRKNYDTLSRNLCFKCLRQFETKSVFIGHLKKKNCINLYLVYCADDTISKEPLPAVELPSSQSSLKAGTKEIIANKVYGCKLCDRTFRLKADFRAHVLVDHVNDQRRNGAESGHPGCSFCPIVFEDSAARKRHLNNLDCIVFLICGTCDNRFDTLAMYIEHVYAEHLPQAAAQAAAVAAAATAATAIPMEGAAAASSSASPLNKLTTAAATAAAAAAAAAASLKYDETDTGELFDPLGGDGTGDSSRLRNPSDCLVCNKRYNNYYNMLRHMESKHPDQMPRTYRCEEGCAVGYARHVELRDHMAKVHGIALPKTKREYFTCRPCGNVFDQRDGWLEHQSTEHGRYYCNQCDMDTDDVVQLDAHLVQEHSAQPDRGGGSSSLAASRANQCTICEHSFNSERGLETHLAVVHQLKRWQMPKRTVKEDDEEANRTKLEDTADSVNGNGMAVDGHDGAAAAGALNNRDAVKRFKPTTGAGAGASASALSIYRRCRICGDTFSGGVALANHMRTHGITSIRAGGSTAAQTMGARHSSAMMAGLSARSKVISRMRCRVCQKRIHTKASYKRHMLNMHGVKNCEFIKCTVCPAEFSNDKGLKVHMFRTHHITVQQMQLDARLRPVKNHESTAAAAAAAAGGQAAKTEAASASATASTEFECNFCHTVYRSRDLLLAHQKLVHGGAAAVKDEPQSDEDTEMANDEDGGGDGDGDAEAHDDDVHQTSHLLSLSLNHSLVDPLESWWQCRYCPETFNASKKLTIHMNSHSEHDTTDFRCTDCNNEYSTRKSLWVHRHKKHPRHPNPSACDLCAKVFFDKTELFHHLKTHSNTDVFSHLTEMQTHLSEQQQQQQQQAVAAAQPDPDESCHICGKRFFDKRVLSKHLRLHDLGHITETGEPAAAAAAATAAASKATAAADDATGTGYIIPSYDGQMVDNEYACDMCPKTFPLMSALKVHRGWHFRSPDGRQVTDTANMWQPDRRASGPAGKRARQMAAAAAAAGGVGSLGGGSSTGRLRTPTCPYCRATFASGNNLRRHIVEVHKRNEARIIRENGSFSDKVQVERDLECSQCDILMEDRAEWVEHKIGHARTMKPSTTFEWGCEICGKIFTRKERLLAHMGTHLADGGAGCVGDESMAQMADGGTSRSSMSSQSQPAGGSGSGGSRLRAQLQKPLEHPGTADSEEMMFGGDDDDEAEEVDDEDEENDVEDEEEEGDDEDDVEHGEIVGDDDDDDDDDDDEGDDDDDDDGVDEDGEVDEEDDGEVIDDDDVQHVVADDDDDDDVQTIDDDEDNDDDAVPKKTTAAAYSCDLCKVFFSTAKSLRRHVASHILNGPAEPAAKTKSHSAATAESEAQPLTGFRCRVCGSSSESHLGMIQCMDAHKVPSAWQCNECQLYCASEQQLGDHSKLCHPMEVEDGEDAEGDEEDYEGANEADGFEDEEADE